MAGNVSTNVQRDSASQPGRAGVLCTLTVDNRHTLTLPDIHIVDTNNFFFILL